MTEDKYLKFYQRVKERLDQETYDDRSGKWRPYGEMLLDNYLSHNLHLNHGDNGTPLANAIKQVIENGYTVDVANNPNFAQGVIAGIQNNSYLIEQILEERLKEVSQYKPQVFIDTGRGGTLPENGFLFVPTHIIIEPNEERVIDMKLKLSIPHQFTMTITSLDEDLLIYNNYIINDGCFDLKLQVKNINTKSAINIPEGLPLAKVGLLQHHEMAEVDMVIGDEDEA